jgi:hypothetical protein
LQGKIAGQNCRAKLKRKITQQNCTAKLNRKIAQQNCRAELQGRIARENGRAKLQGKIAGQTHRQLKKIFANVNAAKGIGGTDYIKYFLTIDKLQLREPSLRL